MTNATPRSHLLFLHCGGTIGMQRDPVSGGLKPSLSADDLLATMPQMRGEFSMELRTLMNIDSSDMQPIHWSRILREIAESYDRFDGFVIAHGTDTMAYTACALSFALQNLGKPVILTGALVPASHVGSDAQMNLAASCQVACMDIAEVAIVFGRHILRGNRATKISGSDRDAFASPVFPNLGEIRFTPEILYPLHAKRHSGSLIVADHFRGDIAVIKCVPGMSTKAVASVLEIGVDGLILEGYAAGNLPSEDRSLLDVLARAGARGIPVVISSQCLYDVTQMHVYEVAHAATDVGAIPAHDMTAEAAYVKLLWVLGKTRRPDEIRELFAQDLAGEMSAGGDPSATKG